jgi:hypothetical protein
VAKDREGEREEEGEGRREINVQQKSKQKKNANLNRCLSSDHRLDDEQNLCVCARARALSLFMSSCVFFCLTSVVHLFPFRLSLLSLWSHVTYFFKVLITCRGCALTSFPPLSLYVELPVGVQDIGLLALSWRGRGCL